MGDNQTGQQVATAGSNAVAAVPPNSMSLSNTNIDTTGLNEQQLQTLRMKHAEAMIDIHKNAQQVKVDVGALGAGLSTMAQSTKEVSEAGNAVTITHTQKNAFGHTEVIMGNTDTAQKGKLSRSQAGLRDMNLIYVAIAAGVLIVLAIIVTHH